MITLELADDQRILKNDHQKWKATIRRIISDAGFNSGSISIAVIGDSEIHKLNRLHLNHDYPTDVLSFVFARKNKKIEGEIIVSYETAIARAFEFNHSPEQELFLYVIHGALHLVGYNDISDAERAEIREQEKHYFNPDDS